MSGDNVTPWVTEDPYSGEMIICHPVASSFAQGTFKSYWAGFNLDWENKNIRAFVSTFPTFSKTTSFYVWWGLMVSHGQTYGIFIPPSHTLNHHSMFGSWEPELPPALRDRLSQMSSSIHNALTNKTCLKEHPELQTYAMNGLEDGYATLLNMAHYRHPKLVVDGHHTSAPKQRAGEIATCPHLTRIKSNDLATRVCLAAIGPRRDSRPNERPPRKDAHPRQDARH
jgi:hypothetical protein